ncbi:hypothetical protein V8E53_006214, partial [Lactarius tabidus]
VGFEDVRRVRAITGAGSVMIATAAEANPTVFSSHPLTDLEDTFILPYLHLFKYLDNYWVSTNFCVSQFRGRRSANKALRNAIIEAKSYADFAALVKDWTGSDESAAIKASIDARATAPPILLPRWMTVPSRRSQRRTCCYRSLTKRQSTPPV